MPFVDTDAEGLRERCEALRGRKQEDNDPEMDHRLEDLILHQYVEMIALERLDPDDIVSIARLITEVVNIEQTRWYS